MSMKRLSLLLCLLLVAGAGSASAKTFFLQEGSAGQLQIGGGLPLPIQLTNPTATGTMFPTLLVPAKVNATVDQTTAMASNQSIMVPANVLSKPPSQLTLGVFGQNPALYAVATNLGYTWPAAAAVLNATARTGASNTVFVTALGNNITYTAVGGKFGGPAQFTLTTAGNTAPGRLPNSAVTIYGIAVPPAGNPPCTHTGLTPVPFPGPGNPACVAALASALPTGPQAVGGVVGNLVTTLGGTMAPMGPVPGVGIGKFGAAPAGTVTFFTFTPAMTMAGFTNMATSRGYPWTRGMLKISAPLAAGAPEVFTITGKDLRTAGGSGTLQLVAGALSQRMSSGPNANRGWIRLILGTVPVVPSLPEWGLLALCITLLGMGGFLVRRRQQMGA